MTSRPTFPLPQGYFDHAAEGRGSALSPDEKAEYKSIAQAQLDAILEAEREFVYDRKCKVDTRKWRLVRKEQKLRIYRRRSGSLGPADQYAPPSLFAAGQVDGTLDDLMYGMHTKTHEELQATMAYMDASVRDATVLHNIEVGNVSDPFRYLGLKWTLTRLPAALLVKSRDWCFVEALGIAQDRDGRRYGYAIAHSVDVANCPPFDDRVAVRAQGSFSLIFRELIPGTVEVFAQGLYDPAGDLIPHVSVTMTIENFCHLSKTNQCAEAKKLTTMAVRHYTATMGYDQQQQQQQYQIQHRCYLCIKGSGMFGSFKMCNVCGVTACAKCRVKKVVFTGVCNSLCEIVCCKTCILEAKSLVVNPASESFVLQANNSDGQQQQQKLPRETIWRGTQQWSYEFTDGERLFSSTEEHEHYDTSDEDLNSLSGASEKDFEKIIDQMIERKFLSRSQRLIPTTRSEASPREFQRTPSWTQSDASPPLSPEYPARISPGVAAQQAELFNRMLALQNAARQVYAITQANQKMMKRL